MDLLPRIAFFGTPHLAVYVLEELERAGVIPSLIVTNPDAPLGRKLTLTESPVAHWAGAHSIPVLKVPSLKNDTIVKSIRASACDLFVVAAYGKLLPQTVLDIPKYRTLNVHPSLLPAFRGASPIRSAILQDANPTGATIMELVVGMDEGPVLAQETVAYPKEEWPPRGQELDERLFRRGGQLLAEIIPQWVQGKVTPHEQDHARATYCGKITKEMGEIDLTADPYQNLLKIRAFDGWPGTYFFTEKNGTRVRVKIIDAQLNEDGSLRITRVTPEGKSEMAYDDFMQR